MITRYQNLIKICYWQKAGGKTKSGYSEPEVHHKEPENKGVYSVSEPHQDLLLTKSGYSESEIHHKEPENKGDYSVSEPHQQK